jgi:hypothetical protein
MPELLPKTPMRKFALAEVPGTLSLQLASFLAERNAKGESEGGDVVRREKNTGL